MYKKEYNFYLILAALLVINIFVFTNFKTTGQAYSFPVGQPHTIYNLLQGISTDSSGYRFVVPDDASVQMISAISSLSSKLNFAGNATITQTELLSLPSSQTNYLIHFTRNASRFNYSFSGPQIKIIETGTSTKLVMGSPDGTGLNESSFIEGINLLANYTSYQQALNTSCVRPDGVSCATQPPVNYSINSCRNITQPGYYYLVSDITSNTPLIEQPSCINITSSNVVLDGRGYKLYNNSNIIEGINAGSYDPTYLGTDYLKNITIKNFKEISGFTGGIRISQVNDSVISNNSITNPIRRGLWFSSSSNLSINYNYIQSAEVGLAIGYYSDFNLISHNRICNNIFYDIDCRYTPISSYAHDNQFDRSGCTSWLNNGKIPCNATNQTNTTCTDSDNGLNYYVKGISYGAWAPLNGSFYNDTDHCVLNNVRVNNCSAGGSCWVNEYYCASVQTLGRTPYSCPYGCSNGACINQTITCYNNTQCGLPVTNNYCNANGSACISTITPTCVNPGTVQSYCSNSTGGTCVACQYGCQNGACLQPAPAPTIAPTISQIKSTQNSLGYRNVIGSTAVQDNIAAVDLAGFLKISQTQDDLQSTAMNYELVIGGPCVNRKAATLLNLPYPSCGNASTIPQNRGIIKTFTNNNKTQILVAGWNAIDTRIAARAVVRYLEFSTKLNSTSVITYGSSLENITVN